MKHILIIIVVAGLIFSACMDQSTSQSGAADILETEAVPIAMYDYQINFEGKIDQYPVEMELFALGDSFWGSYRYLSQQSSLRLQGRKTKDKLELREFTSEGAHSGTFRVYGGFPAYLNGSWVKADNTGSLEFSLDPVSQAFRHSGGYLMIKSNRYQQMAEDSSCEIIFTRPQFSGLRDQGLLENLNKELGMPADSVLNELMEEYGGEVSDYTLHSYVEEGYQINSLIEHLLSVTFYQSSYYSGAAHPNSYSYTVNFDLDQQRVLGNHDLFRPGFEIQMDSLVSRKLREQYPDSYQYFEFEGISDEQNFEMYEDSISTYFNPYDIASYAAGRIEVSMSREEISYLFNPELRSPQNTQPNAMSK